MHGSVLHLTALAFRCIYCTCMWMHTTDLHWHHSALTPAADISRCKMLHSFGSRLARVCVCVCDCVCVCVCAATRAAWIDNGETKQDSGARPSGKPRATATGTCGRQESGPARLTPSRVVDTIDSHRAVTTTPFAPNLERRLFMSCLSPCGLPKCVVSTIAFEQRAGTARHAVSQSVVLLVFDSKNA